MNDTPEKPPASSPTPSPAPTPQPEKPLESKPVDPAPLAPATGFEKAAWILLGLVLFLTLRFHLIAAVLTGLFVHSIIHGLAARIRGKKLNHERAKVVALGITLGVLLLGLTALVLLAVGVVMGRVGDIPALLTKLADTLDKAHPTLEQFGLNSYLPDAGMDSHQLAEYFAERLRHHAEALKHAGKDAGEMALHAVIGLVIGALAAFESRTPGGPFSSALLERLRRFSAAFETVVFAQIKISALNTALTAVYLFAVLPAFGIHLPLRSTLVLLTFVFGMLPVVGNLLSNTITVLISASVSPGVALASLLFLVVIHKLEYFVNAKILGHQIHAAAWEILLAIFTFEAIFGMPGVILAPIVYAYAKRELMDRRLI